MNETFRDALGLIVARVAGLAPDGRVRVVWDDDGECSASAAVIALAPQPDWSRCIGAQVVIGFVRGDVAQPLVLGLLEAPGHGAPPAPPRSLRLRGQEEIVLECGKARIALRADGRIEILGGYLLAGATGPVKIKGASVDVN